MVNQLLYLDNILAEILIDLVSYLKLKRRIHLLLYTLPASKTKNNLL